MSNTKDITPGTKIKLNGRRTVYTVVKSGANGCMDIRGPRGGAKSIVRNIHSGNLYLIDNSFRPKTEAIRELEVVA